MKSKKFGFHPCLQWSGRVGLRGAFGTTLESIGCKSGLFNERNADDGRRVPCGGYKVYRARWYVLLAFSLVSLLQSMIWLTYSPVAETTKRYCNLCKTEAECR